ncbi:hypothetical protein ACLB1R_24260 [Escherichia coli]
MRNTMDGVTGTRSSVWAPNTQSGLGGWAIQLLGQSRHPMRLRKESGIWELFIPGAHNGRFINTR